MFFLIYFSWYLGWIPFFPILAIWGNTNWTSSMKVKNFKILRKWEVQRAANGPAWRPIDFRASAQPFLHIFEHVCMFFPVSKFVTWLNADGASTVQLCHSCARFQNIPWSDPAAPYLNHCQDGPLNSRASLGSKRLKNLRKLVMQIVCCGHNVPN